MEKDPSWPFLVLGDIVQDFAYVDHEDFQIVKCRRQEAYGCGQNGDAIVRGLALFLRLGAEGHTRSSPKLCLSASNEVFERVGSEIDQHKARIHGRDLRLSGRIYTVDGDVMVLRVSFVAGFSPSEFRSYYLVYDSATQSMFLLSRRPPSCRPICTTLPLKLLGGEHNNKYSLVLMAETSDELSIIPSSGKRPIPVICLWSPDSRRDYSRCPWDVKGPASFKADNFEAKVVFVFKGNAVWGDLAQGIMYRDCHSLIDDGAGPEPMEFKHIMLPPRECRATDDLRRHSTLVYRNMGCVGDSIWFVIIEPKQLTCPADTVVKVWTLDLLSEEENWNLHREFKMLELFKAAEGLPETTPKFPFFRQQDDGVLYMLLPEPYKGGGKAFAHLVCIDLSSSCEVRLRSNRRLTIPLMDHPVILDPSFFPTRPFQC